MLPESQKQDHLVTWKYKDYRLELYDPYLPQKESQYYLTYEFYCQGKLIFYGSDYGCSPCHAIDSQECVCTLLSFFALRPEETYSEYFENYTPEQLDFAQIEGEDLNMVVLEAERWEYGDRRKKIELPGQFIQH